jgi:predicted ArsR family transcriptional regulator
VGIEQFIEICELRDSRNLLILVFLSMFLPVFQDLIKPQWRAVLEELKLSGGLPVSELARRVDASYMAVKQHCEELKKLGYLDRSRVPRTVVGRPEIFYSLGARADALFPQAGGAFTLDLLEEMKALFGENAPDKLFFQHFQKQQEMWRPVLSKEPSLGEKMARLVVLRNKEGCYGRVGGDPALGLCIEEFHNPLQRVFESYPRAAAMEQRMIEQLLGTRVIRRELPGGRTGQPRVVFQMAAV